MIQSSEASSTPTLSNHSQDDKVCWSCTAVLRAGELFCPHCGKLQPAAIHSDYFQVFNLTRKLTLDTTELEREFYRLSRRLHPDVFARATAQEQESSLSASSLLNDAYRTLKDPIRRTEYLLKLEGVLDAAEGGAKNEERVPADLLEEVFELNMQLDEMRMNRQTGDLDEQLQKDLVRAQAGFTSQLTTTDLNLRELWSQWDAALESGDSRAQAATKEKFAALLDRRRYIRNLVNSVNEALGG